MTEERLTVMIVENSQYPTGALKSILNHVQTLSDRYRFIFLYNSKLDKTILSGYSEVKFIPMRLLELKRDFTALLYPLLLIRNTAKILLKIKSYNVDIIHINDLYNMLGVLTKIFNPRIKVCYHLRLLPDSYIKPMYSTYSRLLNHFADRVICVSHTALNRAVGIGAGKKVVITDSIQFPSGKTEMSKSEVLQIAYVANFVVGKGQNTAIEILERVKNNTDNFKVNFYGDVFDTSYFELFKKRTRDLSLDKFVQFHGFEGDESNIYHKNHLLLNLSGSESFSMVCLEAISFGIPVITFDSGGPAEIVQDGFNGFVVDSGDLDEVAHKIEFFIVNPEARAEFGENAYRSRDRFAIEKTAARLDETYQQLLGVG